MSDGTDTQDDLRLRLEALSPERRALVERALQARRPGGTATKIEPRTDDGPAPVSYSQELMWLLHELTPGLYTYNSFGAWRLRGSLDPELLNVALEAVTERHGTLRTTFEEHDGEIVQIVDPDLRVSLEHLDRPDLDDEQLKDLLVSFARKPFVLSEPPLYRFMLIRLAPEDHVFMLVTNHILWDGWSTGVLFRELAEVYDARVTGREPELPELPIQYTDFAAWQRKALDGPQMERELAYWVERLAGAPPLLEFPLDHPRPPVKTHDGDRLSLWFDESVLRDFDAAARRAGVTTFMLVSAVWAAFLHRITGEEDIVLGTPLASRNHVELEGLIGYFANTIALRVDCAGDPTFEQFLAGVRATVVEALANQEVPFERVLRAVATQRDASYSPVFQSIVVFQNAAPKAHRLGGIDSEFIPLDPRTAKVDLSMGVGVRGGRLHASFEWNTDLFDTATIHRFRDQFERLLLGCLEDPSRRLSELPLLSAADADQALGAGRGEATPIPDQTLYERFVAQAAATPDAEAVRWHGEALSYGTLAARAATVAGAIHERAAGAPVGFCLERTPDMIVAVLGILGAGSAAVPLDAAYPDDRLDDMIDRAGLALVVTDPRLRDRLSRSPAPVCEVADLVAGDSATLPATPVDAAAYIIFTSGSTGRPKAVVLEHRGLVNHALASIDRYDIGPEDRVLQFASPSFDISIEEIFCSLLSGATLVLREEDVPLGGTGFASWLEREAITVMDLPTAFWHEWTRDLSTGGLAPPSGLRLLIVGGEKVVAESFDTWRALAPSVRFINSYGPTEASVVATAFEPPDGWVRPAGRELPIGTPLRNVDVYVLDAHGGPVSDGVRGELHIGGAGVAREYLADPEATASKFVTQATLGGERVYRTGDLVRRLPDGGLEYAGRVDDQIKLRGFRVEPGEVESALLVDRRVGQAAVVLGADAAGEPRLVGYVVPTGVVDERLPAALRARLADKLPSFMVPSAIVVLEALPLTPNGKLDHRALPAPDLAAASGAPEPPATETETKLVDIWTEVLRQPVGVLDGFFEVGGHSMLAVRMFTMIERQLGVRIPLATLLQAPTVRDLAVIIDSDSPVNGDFRALVPIRPGGTRTPLFLVHSLTGDVLIYRHLVERLDQDLPIYGLEAVGFDAQRVKNVGLPTMARLYVEEMRLVQPYGPYRMAGLCYGGWLAHEMAHQLEQAGESVELVGLIDAHPPGLVRRPGTAKRIISHLIELGELDSGARTAFLVSTGRNVRERSQRFARSKVRKHLYVNRGRDVPPRLMRVMEMHIEATAGYKTPTIAGQATLFRVKSPGVRPTSDLQERWSEFAAGGMIVRDIASPGATHLTVLAEPHVRLLARQIEDALSGDAPHER